MSFLGNTPTTQSFTSLTERFNGNGSATTVTLSRAVYNVSDIEVLVNNVQQDPYDAYTVDGTTTLTFTEAPSIGTGNIIVTYRNYTITRFIPTENTVSGSSIQTGAVTGDKIAANTITGDKIAANTIGSSNLTITGVTAGSYGGVGNTASITVDAQGRITRSSNVTNQWLATGSDVYTLSSVLVGSTSAIAGYTQVSVTGSSTNRGAFVMGRTTAATTGVAGTLLAYNGSNAICGMDFQSNSANNSGYIGTYTYSAGSFVQGPYLNTAGTSWTTASDQNLKDVTCEITNALNKISQIRAVEFTWKADKTKKQHVGFIAQDVQAVLPEVIDTDTNGHLGVRYAEVTSLLLAAIKEQQTLIESLTTRLTALEQT